MSIPIQSKHRPSRLSQATEQHVYKHAKELMQERFESMKAEATSEYQQTLLDQPALTEDERRALRLKHEDRLRKLRGVLYEEMDSYIAAERLRYSAGSVGSAGQGEAAWQRRIATEQQEILDAIANSNNHTHTEEDPRMEKPATSYLRSKDIPRSSRQNASGQHYEDDSGQSIGSSPVQTPTPRSSPVQHKGEIPNYPRLATCIDEPCLSCSETGQ
jgi:hypothetical protein